MVDFKDKTTNYNMDKRFTKSIEIIRNYLVSCRKINKAAIAVLTKIYVT